MSPRPLKITAALQRPDARASGGSLHHRFKRRRQFPASHTTEQTWIDAGVEGEVLRCIPGAHLKITLSDVAQSDQGVAGTFASGTSLECAPNEALRHFKDGMLKCVANVPVKDCTERTNLRRWGTGDLISASAQKSASRQKRQPAPRANSNSAA